MPAMHFSKTIPGVKCLICGAAISDTAPMKVSKGSTAVVGRNYTNDPGFYNSFPDRCMPRHHISNEGGKHTLVGVHSVHGPKPSDPPKELD